MDISIWVEAAGRLAYRLAIVSLILAAAAAAGDYAAGQYDKGWRNGWNDHRDLVSLGREAPDQAETEA